MEPYAPDNERTARLLKRLAEWKKNNLTATDMYGNEYSYRPSKPRYGDRTQNYNNK